jgi:hypothetical protein
VLIVLLYLSLTAEPVITTARIYIYKRTFYQDRLGTNIGKTQKRAVFPHVFDANIQELYVNPEENPDPAAAEEGGGLLEVAAHLGLRLLQEGPSPGTLALDPKALWHVIDALRRSGE